MFDVTQDIIYGVKVRHYVPFFSQCEALSLSCSPLALRVRVSLNLHRKKKNRGYSHRLIRSLLTCPITPGLIVELESLTCNWFKRLPSGVTGAQKDI